MSSTTLIECPACRARVQAQIMYTKECPPNNDLNPHKYCFLECSSCHGLLLGFSEMEQISLDEWGYENMMVRLWPSPSYSFDFSVPRVIRDSLTEAKLCLNSGAWMACTVMCGRAIEAICREFSKIQKVDDALKELKEKFIIDEKIYKWSVQLMKERNISAHPDLKNDSPSKQDAQDLYDFSISIVEYIYVLEKKYQEYMKRKEVSL